MTPRGLSPTLADVPLAEILTIDQVSLRLSASPKTLREWAETSGFPLWRLSARGMLYVYEREVAEWVGKNRTLIGRTCQGK